MMVLPRVQYVTHPDQDYSSFRWVHNLHEAGIRWIQLRIKESDFYRRNADAHYQLHFLETADALRTVTEALGMLLTVNDSVSVLNLSTVDGIHVGQEDTPVEEVFAHARGRIIGATANSLEEVKNYPVNLLNYLGVGPFRATSTKEKLKPVLGLEGYRRFCSELAGAGIELPVFAIGGITPDDIPALMQTGVYGLALSGAIHKHLDDVEKLRTITDLVLEKHG